MRICFNESATICIGRFPTLTTDTARVLEKMSAAYVESAQKESFGGVFHWQANERHTKYTMGTIIAEIAGLDASNLVPSAARLEGWLAAWPWETLTVNRFVLPVTPVKLRIIFVDGLNI